MTGCAVSLRPLRDPSAVAFPSSTATAPGRLQPRGHFEPGEESLVRNDDADILPPRNDKGIEAGDRRVLTYHPPYGASSRVASEGEASLPRLRDFALTLSSASS